MWDPNGKTKIEENMQIGHQKGFHLIVNSIEEAKNTNSTLQGAVHKLCRLKNGDFWPPHPLFVVFLLSKIGN